MKFKFQLGFNQTWWAQMVLAYLHIDSPETQKCVFRCTATLPSEWQLSFNCPANSVLLTNQSNNSRKKKGHQCPSTSLSPPSFLLSALTDEPHTTSEKGAFAPCPTMGEHLSCVLFSLTDAERFLSLYNYNKWKDQSRSLCARRYLGFEAIDVFALFWRVIPSVLDSVPHLLSSPSNKAAAWLCGCPLKKTQRNEKQIWYCFILAVFSLSFWLVVLKF